MTPIVRLLSDSRPARPFTGGSLLTFITLDSVGLFSYDTRSDTCDDSAGMCEGAVTDHSRADHSLFFKCRRLLL